MLSEEQIKQTLHADRVVPLNVANPHGPLGLEQLCEAVSCLRESGKRPKNVERPIALPLETWQKLFELARSASLNNQNPMSASDVAAAILVEAVKKQ